MTQHHLNHLGKEILDEAVKIYISEHLDSNESIKKARKLLGDYYKNLNNVQATMQNDDINLLKLITKLQEEQKEVNKAYTIADRKNLIEELLDVLQMIVNILTFLDTNLSEAIKEHNIKLKERGWSFKETIFKLNKNIEK